MAESTSPKKPKHYSLSDLARSLTAQIEQTYSGKYWIVAEISKLNHYPQSGHAYPQLVEKKGGKIIAEMRGFISKWNFQKIRQDFLSKTGKEPGDGMQILFRCKLSYHALYGFSLFVLDIEPSFTMGEMARMRSEAIQKLRAEHLFDKNKGLQLPMLVQKIAVVSVETSKGYHDFTKVLQSSPFPDTIDCRLFPALIQGDAAVESISAALIKIKDSKTNFDAVAIIRGGGGETGLDCYDNYRLAREVSLFPIPVLTGIGHATNLTVVEQVAYQNLITPTDLARNLVQRFIDFGLRLNKAKRSLLLFRRGWFKLTQNNLNQQRERLLAVSDSRIREEKKSIRRLGNRMGECVAIALSDAKVAIEHRHPARLSTAVKSRLDTQNRILGALSGDTTRVSQIRIVNLKKDLNFISEKLRILDPQNTLKRGFSITTLNGKPLTDKDAAESGSEIETRLWKGSLKSTVK